MASLFSDEWMKAFMNEWNSDPKLAGALAEINFNSVIGYGFPDSDQPKGVITVEGGRVVSAGAYNGESLGWDMRASASNWQKWLSKGIGGMGLGMAYTRGQLQFRAGDYGAMIKNPRMAGPFMKSFAAMGRV